MTLEIDFDTFDIIHYHDSSDSMRLSTLIDELLEHLHLDIVGGEVVCKEDDGE